MSLAGPAAAAAGELPPPIARAMAHQVPIRLYVQVALLVGCTLLLGRAGIGAVRYGFIAGCLGIGIQAWRHGPGRHLEISIILFVVAPFLRRVVDFSAGFDASGVMLVGPLVALLPPSVDLYDCFVKGRLAGRSLDPARSGGASRILPPYVLMVGCLLYACALSIINGQVMQMAVGAAKCFIPGMYGLWLALRGGEKPDVMQAAARGCMVALPLAGVYAVYQYFYLPDWDSYWISMTSGYSNAQGAAEAEKVRVFSTMNSAASFGHFAAAGLLLLGFVNRSRLSLLLCVPVAAGLMLSLYRTSWMGLAASLAYCWMYGQTRRRAELVFIWMLLAAALMLATPSIGDVMIQRLSTFGAASQDASGQARLGEFQTLYDHSDDLWLGDGLTGQAGPGAGRIISPKQGEGTDGSFVDAVKTMGWFGGALYLIGLFWVAAQGLVQVADAPERQRVVAGAVVVGYLVALPLTSITVGEIGFVFWSFLGIATAPPRLVPPPGPPGWPPSAGSAAAGLMT